jgi:hypothetical protein
VFLGLIFTTGMSAVCQLAERNRKTLDFIQNGSVPQAGHKPHWIGLGCGQLNIVVKGDVFITGRVTDHTGQSGFAALASPMDQHHRGVLQRLLQPTEHKSRI